MQNVLARHKLTSASALTEQSNTEQQLAAITTEHQLKAGTVATRKALLDAAEKAYSEAAAEEQSADQQKAATAAHLKEKQETYVKAQQEEQAVRSASTEAFENLKTTMQTLNTTKQNAARVETRAWGHTFNWLTGGYVGTTDPNELESIPTARPATPPYVAPAETETLQQLAN